VLLLPEWRTTLQLTQQKGFTIRKFFSVFSVYPLLDFWPCSPFRTHQKKNRAMGRDGGLSEGRGEGVLE